MTGLVRMIERIHRMLLEGSDDRRFRIIHYGSDKSDASYWRCEMPDGDILCITVTRETRGR